MRKETYYRNSRGVNFSGNEKLCLLLGSSSSCDGGSSGALALCPQLYLPL